MGSSSLASRAHTWIRIIESNRQDPAAVFFADFQTLCNICPGIRPLRVIKSSMGTPHVVYLDKKTTVDLLKNRYGFLTKQEAGQELKDATND